MKIDKIIEEFIKTVKERDALPCDSKEADEKDEKIDQLVRSVKYEDREEFNREINNFKNW